MPRVYAPAESIRIDDRGRRRLLVHQQGRGPHRLRLTGCHCPVSVAHFRRWLADRYGTIDALNDAWGTAFWGRRYDSFDHIGTPAPRSRLISGPNPGQLLDFARFSDTAALECYTAERDIVRRHTPDLPITTNFMGSFKHLDYWRWAAEEEVVSLGIYPSPRDTEGQVFAAYNFDLMRSLRGGRPWLMLESATDNNLTSGRNHARPAGRLRARSLQAVARGADSVMFFQWRASRVGAERFHSAMVPHGGTRTRTWREVTALGQDVARLADLTGGVCDPAEVAVVWDWENWWALEGPSIGLSPTTLAICGSLDAAGQPGRAAELRFQIIGSARQFVRMGKQLPAHEVTYEQSIVAPLLDLLIDAHGLTGDPVFHDAIAERLPWLLAFGGPQPHARLHGIAIRHWDGFWFGADRLWGDVFPHYWSTLTAGTLLRLPATLRTAHTDRLAEAILRANMANYREDGSATCAFVMPSSVDGRAAHAAGPLVNDQDWHLLLWLQARQQADRRPRRRP